MALYQRGQVWYADYYAYGRRVQESTGLKNRRAAERFYALRLSEVSRGAYSKPIRTTLIELGERYLTHAKMHKRSWKRDEQLLASLIDFFGGANLEQISPMRIEDFQRKRIERVSPATANREVALLKHMFNTAEKWQLHSGPNPVRQVRFLAENNLQFRTLSEEEEKALIAECPMYLADIVIFALNTGLRSGEIFNLKWEDVDLEARRLQTITSKTRRRLELPLNDSALRVLQSWQAIKRGPNVFYNWSTGSPFVDLSAGLRKACKAAAIDGVTWHTFRHTFASRLTRKGVDIVTVKELLGHSTVTVTMRYAHSNHETKARAVSRLASSDKTVTVLRKRPQATVTPIGSTGKVRS